MNNLDLYAKIEPMIGFYEAYEMLYKNYLHLLKQYHVRTILDVGCGNGKFLKHLEKKYQAEGIDLSLEMVKIAKKSGVNARQCYLHEVDKKYDAIVAAGDVLNYMQENSLKKFLDDICEKLEENGTFICDINTLYGFEDIAAGCMNVDEDEKFLAIDASFDENILETNFTLFSRQNHCYQKEEATIFQYYHEVKEIESLTTMKLVEIKDISLFSDESDKTILVFQKA